jgi:hypothetical protein
VWAGQRSLVDGELLAQGQVLEGELAVAADEKGEEPEEVEQESDHEPRVWPDRRDISTLCAPDGVLAKDNPNYHQGIDVYGCRLGDSGETSSSGQSQRPDAGSRDL